MSPLAPIGLPGLLSNGDIALMRNLLDESLPGTAFLLRRSVTDDGQGGQTQTYGTAGTLVCRVSPISPMKAGGEETHGDRITSLADRVITFPANTTVLATDRVSVGAQVFEVLAVHAPRSWEISTRVDVVGIS